MPIQKFEVHSELDLFGGVRGGICFSSGPSHPQDHNHLLSRCLSRPCHSKSDGGRFYIASPLLAGVPDSCPLRKRLLKSGFVWRSNFLSQPFGDICH